MKNKTGESEFPLFDGQPAFEEVLHFGQPANKSANELHLSTTIIETIFFAFVCVLGIHVPLTILAQQIKLPFNEYLFISPLITIFCLVGVARIQSVNIRQAPHKDYSILLWLFLLGLICATLSIFTHRISTDDYFYVPNAVYFLDHPTEPLDFAVHFLVRTPNDPIISQSQGTALTYEYFRSVIAYYLRADFLTVYYLSGVVMAFLLPSAYYLLINRFVNNSKNAVIGTFISIALILVSLQGKGFANPAFRHAYIGKTSVLSIGIPIFCAFSIGFFIRPSLRNWILLSASTIAFVGMTTSASVLLVILAIVLLGSSIITTGLTKMNLPALKNKIYNSWLYLTSLWFLFIYSLFLYLQIRRGATSSNPFEIDGPTNFGDPLRAFLGPGFPFTLILMGISLILVFMWVKDWQRKFLLLWMTLLVLLFINPFSAQLMINTFIPSNIYWRLFYLTPFPLSAGGAIANLPFRSYVSYIFSLTILIFAIVFYLAVNQQQGTLLFSINKLPVQDLDVARQITGAAPHGIMLAPENLYGLIPMIDGFHPQIRTREDGDKFWLTKNESEMRENASRFAGGNLSFINDFSHLLNKNIVETIVLRKTIFEGASTDKANGILNKNGFKYRKIIGDYVIVWK